MDEWSSGKRNVWVLTAAQALGGTSTPIVISLGGLVGQQLTSNPELLTLPISLLNLGLALGTLPAMLAMRRLGRRAAYVLGGSIGMMAGLIAALGILKASFLIFCIGTSLAGFYSSFVQSYRFAAADSVSGMQRDRAIARVMIGGLIAAIVGPQLVIWTRASTPDAPFAGSFLSQAVMAALVIPVVLMLRNSPSPKSGASREQGGRAAVDVLMSWRYLLAVATGVVSYGLMTFVMTAAPVAMVGCGHSVDAAALGIQWHILAMFGPSFLTGRLMARFGKERVAAFGLLLTAISALVALSGLDIAHFWGSLVLLGLGWNLSFIGATAMVTDCYTHSERALAQGTNDFAIFGTVAIASFFSGSLLHNSGWMTINWFVLPTVAVILVPLVWRAARPQIAL